MGQGRKPLGNFIRNIVLSVIVSVSFVTAALAGDFVFTAIPDEDETRLRQRFDKVAVYLTKELGVKVRYIPVKSYAAAVTAFRRSASSATISAACGDRPRRVSPASNSRGLSRIHFMSNMGWP